MKRILWVMFFALMGIPQVQASFFDVFLELSCPSVHYPQQSVPYMQLNARRTTSTDAEEMVRYSFGNGTTGGTALRAVSQGDGNPITPNMPDSFFDVFLETFSGGATPGNVPNQSFMIDSFFDVFCSTGQGGQVGDVVVNYLAPDSFFDIFLEMNVPTAGGEQTIHIHGTLNPDQPVAFAGGTVTTGTYGIDSFFDIFTEICSTVGNESTGYFGGYNVNAPLMTMQIEIIPEPATMILLTLGGLSVVRRKRS
jgi:hypothetical protein